MSDKKITVRLDENTYYEFKKICVKEMRYLSRQGRIIIENFVKSYHDKGKKILPIKVDE